MYNEDPAVPGLQACSPYPMMIGQATCRHVMFNAMIIPQKRRKEGPGALGPDRAQPS